MIVSTGAGIDLSGVKVRHADRKDVITVAREVNREAREVRAGERTDIERGKHLLETLPLPLLRVFLRLAAFLTVDLGWDLKKIGLPREAFGSAMVSSVGMFGITDGYSPLSPLYRVPFIIVVGQVRRAPWVEGDKVVVRPVLPIGVSIDHRWLDGHQIARLSKSFREYLADPLRYEPAELAAPAFAGGKHVRAAGARS